MKRAALNLNVHFHCVILDGVFVHEQSGGARFVSLSEPPDGEVKAVLRRIAIRLLRLLRPRLQAQELEQLDPLASAQSEALLLPIGSLAGPSSTSATARSSMASRYTPVSTCTQTIAKGLERLCGYGARPPLSQERLTALPDGWLVYRLKRPLANGRTALVMQPTELLRRLATLVPPPRHNLVRYHGVFAPNAAWRAAIVPPPPEEPEPATAEPVPMAATVPRKAKARLPWAELLLRVFREDVLQCDRCGGRRAVIAFITQPQVIKAILQHLGLPTTGPPVSAARSTLQPDLFCQDEQAPDDRDVS